tara:strand:+ start:5186 stop:5581 length:396 start_codon:yes stop_codon:yes gene_type:complete
MIGNNDSFNNSVMVMVGVPLILSWLVFACFVIYSGVRDETGFIQTNLDFYVALIAIIGGPALLYIQAILEAWKSEQSAKLNTLPQRLEMEIQQSLAKHTHALEMATAKLSHSQMLEDREQQHKHKGENEDE